MMFILPIPPTIAPGPLRPLGRVAGCLLVLEGPVVYRDASGRRRKAWLQGRHAAALVAACGEPPGPEAARLRANVGRRETKRDWTYIDY
jgi:hypothetical protein